MTLPEVKPEKFPWIQVIVATAIVGFVGMTAQSLSPAWQHGTFGRFICVMQLAAAPFIVIAFSALLSKLGVLRKEVGLAYTSYVYISVLSAVNLMDNGVNDIWGMVWQMARYAPGGMVRQYVPSFVAPELNVVNVMLQGGPIPWGVWIPIVLFWWIGLLVIPNLAMLSVVNLFRRGWIDIERVPFPHVEAAYEMISNSGLNKIKTTGHRMRFFVIGLVIGLVLHVIIDATVLIPWFPDILGWRVNTCGSGQYYVPADSPLASIVGLTSFQKYPGAYAVAYLAPLSVSFNAWFWYLIYLIAVQIVWTAGYYTGLDKTAGCGRAWCGIVTPNYGEPFKMVAFAGGGMIALSVVYLLIQWRYFGDTIKAALGILPKETIKEIEKDEPMTYRQTYIMIVVLHILWILALLASGFNLLPAIIVTLTLYAFFVASARMWSMAGIHMSGGLGQSNVLMRAFAYPTAPVPADGSFVLSAYFATFWEPWGFPYMFTLGGYRMAALTGIKNKNAFKAMIIGLTVMPLVTMLGYLLWNYTYGASKLPSWGSPGSIFDWTSSGTWNGKPAPDPWVPQAVVGLLAVSVIWYLSHRFIWFPFEPVGFLIGVGASTSILYGYWFPFLVAWILKTITLRVGGSKAYEGYGIPLAGGVITGAALSALVAVVVGMTRFFVPF